MGVRRLFSKEGQNFPGDRGPGQKHTICLKMPKNILFSFRKVEKLNILADLDQYVRY